MYDSINIVWFKRDLRLNDHQPLMCAVADNTPALLVYFFEPTSMAGADSDVRHWRFVQESIHDLNQTLQPKHQIYAIHQEVVTSLEQVQKHFKIKTIFSHQETGNAITYQRDKDVAAFCSRHQIEWKEYPTNGVVRRLYHRNNFNKRWFETMSTVEFDVDVEKIQSVQLPAGLLPPYAIVHPTNKNFQPGGVSAAKKYLSSFLYERKTNYSKHISKPQESRTGCSRLSPYLAWGNLSMKQVYQATLQAIGETGDTRNLNFFVARLHWHCHFIQKFETECRMEFENLNRGFDSIRKEIDPQLITAWEQGKTGYPLVDACMRCVVETGYLNFRMRSMVVSFLTHHLWQPWQAGAHFLAKHFLDYEPGIHYPQLQMQAGTMGVNTIRIYNPVKQSQEHDPEGLFIKKWVAALKHVPTKHIHEPWKMTVLEQQMCNVILGVDYPTPIIDMEEKSRYARNQLWNIKNSVTTQRENLQILKKHTKRKTVEEQPIKRKRGVTNKSVSK